MSDPSEPSKKLVVLFFVGWTHILLYGFNAVLFMVGMYLLRKRKGRQGSMFLSISSSFLFAFATVSAIVSTVLVVGGYLTVIPGSPPTSINLRACSIVQYLLVHLTDLTAFTVMAYRCFNIWGRRYLVIVLPVVLFLVETGVYYSEFPQYINVQYIDDPTQQNNSEFMKQSLPFTAAAVVLAAVANAFLTLLIAGRMWWLKRQMQDFMRDGVVARGNLSQRYESIIAMTLESGMIIPTFFIVQIVYDVRSANTGTQGDVFTILSTMLTQIIAFAPLIILVRVGLGLTVERDEFEDSATTMSNRDSQGRSLTVPHVLNIHRDVTVSVSVAPPEDVELSSISKGQKF